MRKKIRTNLIKILKSQLFTGSMVMIIGTNIFNITQFIYHFIAGRLLPKNLYGDLASMLSLVGLIGIIQVAFGLTIIKFIATESNKKGIANLVKWIEWWSILIGFAFSIVMFIASPFLRNFLKIDNPGSFYLLIPIIFFSIILYSHRSILQGILKFDGYVFSLLMDALFKISFTVALILLGWATFGAMTGFLVGIISGLIISRWTLSSFFQGRKGKMPNILPLFKYSIPAFVQSFALTSMYSADVLLVKHFFSAEEAGTYASVAVLGRVVFFGASPITQVMFPLVAKRFSKGESHRNLFFLSLVMTSVIALLVVILYKLIPEIPITVLYGENYLIGTPLLWWFGLFMTLVVLSMLFGQYYLSIGKTRIIWVFVVFALLQLILISIFHSNLLIVIQMSIVSAALLSSVLFVYFLLNKR